MSAPSDRLEVIVDLACENCGHTLNLYADAVVEPCQKNPRHKHVADFSLDKPTLVMITLWAMKHRGPCAIQRYRLL